MEHEISAEELRINGGEISRRLEAGESFVVTRSGAPVGELRPMRRSRFVRADVVAAAFRSAPAVDGARFRADIEAVAEHGVTRPT